MPDLKLRNGAGHPSILRAIGKVTYDTRLSARWQVDCKGMKKMPLFLQGRSHLESSASHYCVNIFLGFEDGKLESNVGRVTGSKGY